MKSFFEKYTKNKGKRSYSYSCFENYKNLVKCLIFGMEITYIYVILLKK